MATGIHFYAWFPGDYARDTAHLSMVEDAAYRRLLDAYYMTGRVSANAEVLPRVCRAITPDEQAAVLRVVAEFFEVRDGYLYHPKVEHELARSRAISGKRADAGRRGAEKTNSKRSANAAANAVAIASASDAANVRQPIPTYSVSKDTDAGASSPPPAKDSTDPKEAIFAIGVSILTKAGDTEKAARAFLAKYARQDETKLAEVLAYLATNAKVEPKSYIVAALKPKAREVAL